MVKIPLLNKYILSIFIISALFIAAGVMSAQKYIVTPYDTNQVNKEYFGMHILDPAGVAVWPKTDEFGSVRLWDNKVIWSNLQPGKDKWYFDDLDRLVNNAHELGADVLLVLGQTPTWASMRPSEPSPYYAGNAAGPRDLVYWKRYVHTVAKRYRGRVHAYEIWNEVNAKNFWTGSFREMAELERVAYKIIKSIDPKAKVVSASLTNTNRRTVDRFFNAGNGRFADVISYHFYAPTSEPEVMLDSISMVRSVMEKYGIGDKPIWNTETGWLIPNPEGEFTDKRVATQWKYWLKLSREQGAAFPIRALLVSRLAGVERFYWYGWNHGPLGLTSYGWKKGPLPLVKYRKKALYSYLSAYDWLTGSRVEGCKVDNPIWVCGLRKGNKLAWLAWSVRGNYRLPKEVKQTAVAFVGLNQTKPNKIPIDMQLGEIPVLFLGQQGEW